MSFTSMRLPEGAAAAGAPRLLVFGRSGQLASALADLGPRAGWRVRLAGRPDCDVRDPRSVARAFDGGPWTAAVNAAAWTDVDGAEADPAGAFALNEAGAAAVAEACAARGVPLVHLSTDYVFGGVRVGRPLREDDPVAPLGVYGASKAAGEAAVRALCPAHAVVRTAWLHGPRGRNFATTMVRLAAERRELRVVADRFGSPTLAADLAAAVLRVARRLADGAEEGRGTWHVAGGGGTSWHGFAEAIMVGLAAAGRPVPRLLAIPSSEYPTPAARPVDARLDCRRAALAFGVAVPDWRDGVRRCLAGMGVARGAAVA